MLCATQRAAVALPEGTGRFVDCGKGCVTWWCRDEFVLLAADDHDDAAVVVVLIIIASALERNWRITTPPPAATLSSMTPRSSGDGSNCR